MTFKYNQINLLLWWHLLTFVWIEEGGTNRLESDDSSEEEKLWDEPSNDFIWKIDLRGTKDASCEHARCTEVIFDNLTTQFAVVIKYSLFAVVLFTILLLFHAVHFVQTFSLFYKFICLNDTNYLIVDVSEHNSPQSGTSDGTY